MGAVGDIAESIGGAIGSIVDGIKRVVSTVISAVQGVVSTVVNKIRATLHLIALPIKAIAVTVYSGLRDVISLKVLDTVSNALKTVSAIYFNRLGVASFLESHIGSIGASVASFIQSWYGRVRDFISSIVGYIRAIVEKIKKYVEPVIARIRHIYESIKASIIGKILKTISKFIDIIETIHTIAMILRYIKEEKYFKAIYYAVISYDKKLARSIEKITTYINSQISAVYKNIRETYYLIRDDLAYLDGYAHRLEKVISDIGNAFGVESIQDIARGIRAFREEILATAYSYLDEFTKKTRDYVNVVAYPLNQMLWTMRLTRLEYRRYQTLFSYLTVDAINSNFLKEPKPYRLIVPVLVE